MLPHTRRPGRTSDTSDAEPSHGRTAKRRQLRLLTVLVGVLLAGCTTIGGNAVKATGGTASIVGPTDAPRTSSTGTTGSAAGPPTTPQSFPPPVAGKGQGLLWTQNAAKPLGQPKAVGDGVVVYALRGSALSIEVVDAATGRIRWQQLAATGAAAAGIEISPVVLDGHVVYLRPVQGSMVNTSVVVADAVTGQDIAVSQHDYRVGSRPEPCQNVVCFSAYDGVDEQALTMDTTTGAVTSAGTGTGGRNIGPEGLVSVQAPPQPEQLTRIVNGKSVWAAPITSIFGAGYSTNGGWNFHVLPKRKLLIGTVGVFDPTQPIVSQLKLGTALEMAGIDLTDGARRWLVTGGVDYQCMPQAAVIEGGSLVSVRCRWGATTIAERVGKTLVLRTASLSVEGFDPATGATTWSVSLVDPTGTSPQAAVGRIEVVDEDTLLVPGRTGAELIEPASGAVRPAPVGTRAVCLVDIETPLAGGERTINGRTTNDYLTGSSATRCTADAAPTSTAGPTWPSWIGIAVHRVHVVTTTAGLQGYRA